MDESDILWEKVKKVIAQELRKHCKEEDMSLMDFTIELLSFMNAIRKNASFTKEEREAFNDVLELLGSIQDKINTEFPDEQA